VNADLVKLASARPAAGSGARPAALPGAAQRPAVQATEQEAEPPAARSQTAAVEQAMREVNRQLAEKGRELTIEFEDALNRMVFKLVDSKTGEVVRQIPSEDVLAIARALKDNVSTGVLLRGDA
jgi:flagellar protein FlaG